MLFYIVGLGIVFDFITLRAIILTVAENKFRPAVPYVSLFCYSIFLCVEFITCLDVEDFSNPLLVLAGGLIALHILLQTVLRFAKKKYD